jgi:hypothetical protein
MFFKLPVELQHQCVRSLDVATFRSLRLVNKSAIALATEHLFSTVVLLPTNASAEKYMTVLESTKLNPIVQGVIFNTSEDPLSDERKESVLLDSFRDALFSVTRFRNLRKVDLKFARNCAMSLPFEVAVAETEHFRTEVLRALFYGLNKKRNPPAHVPFLTVKNLQDRTDEKFYDSVPFLKVTRRLQRLHLQIATEDDEDCPYQNSYQEGCQRCFNVGLPNRWLKPLQTQLTHLSLYSAECMWGFWPMCPLRDMHFPSLKSLALGNWTIVHEWQIDWLLSHGPTLEELILDDCPIVTTLKMYADRVKTYWPDAGRPWTNYVGGLCWFKEAPLRWHHVFPRFQDSFPRLCNFAMGSGTTFEQRYELAARCVNGRYYMFDDERLSLQWIGGDESWIHEQQLGENGPMLVPVRGYRFLMEGRRQHTVYFPTCDAEDMEALVALMDVVKERASVAV